MTKFWEKLANYSWVVYFENQISKMSKGGSGDLNKLESKILNLTKVSSKPSQFLWLIQEVYDCKSYSRFEIMHSIIKKHGQVIHREALDGEGGGRMQFEQKIVIFHLSLDMELYSKHGCLKLP